MTRVEPSLQAAFVDYGGNRHGFLAFSEIHPDYYQIPVADRQALIDEDERAQRAAEAEADHRAGRRHARRERASDRARDEVKSEPVESAQAESAQAESTQIEGAQSESDVEAMAAASEQMAPLAGSGDAPTPDAGLPVESVDEPIPAEHTDPSPTTIGAEAPMELAALETSSASEPVPTVGEEFHADEIGGAETADAPAAEKSESEPHDIDVGHNITEVNGHGAEGEEEIVESVGGADAMEEVPERMSRRRRQYKIQEVIKRRQVMLVQVVKEERGTKGAALTTYLSLAGRYSVLMPNTARGGGISRKITNSVDRKRLKEMAQELEVPEGMGVILRTAGASRTKTEIKRDFEYLLRLWETVRDLTLKSTAPTLVYEEGSLVKRSIRDLYNKDIDEILVAGADAYRDARDFMRMLMPSHAKNVKPYRDNLPIFGRFGIESQLDAMFQPVVQLRSGGYIVHQPGRGAGRHRRQFGPRHPRAPYRGHRAQDQSRGRRGDRPAAAPARSRRADRHRLHRHGREAQQPHGRAAVEGGPQARPRAHPGRAHLAFRPPGDVAPAHPLERAGKLDREMPALRRHRPCALGLLGRAAAPARDRGNAAQGRHPQSHRAHPHRDRALSAQPQARPSARARGALPAHHHGECRRHASRARCPT